MPSPRRDHHRHLLQHQRRLEYLRTRLRLCGNPGESDRIIHDLQVEERLVAELSHAVE